MQYFFKIGNFLISYLCDKQSAILVMPGVYSKSKKDLTKAEIDALTKALNDNGIKYKDGTKKISSSKCKYTYK